MGRKLSVVWMSAVAVASCGDDFSEVEPTGDDFTISGDEFDESDSFDDTWGEVGPESSVSVSVSDSDTWEVTSDTWEDTSITITDSDTWEDTSDTWEDTSITITDSDTWEDTSGTSDSDTHVTGSTTDTETDPTATGTTTEGTATDPTTTSVGPTTDTDATTGTTTTDTETDTDTDTETDTDGGGFPEAPAFGTNVLDLDLVGVWGLNWDPASGFDSVLDIDDSGNFMWTETSADCSTETVASGYLWVEGVQIVMHVELWDRPLPWDTEPVVGETFEPPFRLRMSFSLQGGPADDYLAIAAPGRITAEAPYTGESYVRTSTLGAFLGGVWHGEAQLDAIPAGETSPVVIVRDTYEAQLELEIVDGTPEGFGTRRITTQYFPVQQQSSTFDGANWTCLSGCPDPSGLTLVDGANLYTYGPYAGYEHLLTFESGRTFRSNVVSDCP